MQKNKYQDNLYYLCFVWEIKEQDEKHQQENFSLENFSKTFIYLCIITLLKIQIKPKNSVGFGSPSMQKHNTPVVAPT